MTSKVEQSERGEAQMLFSCLLIEKFQKYPKQKPYPLNFKGLLKILITF